MPATIKQFSVSELASMFYAVETDENGLVTREKHYRPARESSVSQSLQRDRMPIGDDYIREGITSAAPGSSERIEALCAFYEMAVDCEESAFSL